MRGGLDVGSGSTQTIATHLLHNDAVGEDGSACSQAAGVCMVLLLSEKNANNDVSTPLRKAELHLECLGLASNVKRPNWFMQNFNLLASASPAIHPSRPK